MKSKLRNKVLFSGIVSTSLCYQYALHQYKTKIQSDRMFVRDSSHGNKY